MDIVTNYIHIYTDIIIQTYVYIIYKRPLVYVTGFMKTGPNHTRTEIHFIA